MYMYVVAVLFIIHLMSLYNIDDFVMPCKICLFSVVILLVVVANIWVL